MFSPLRTDSRFNLSGSLKWLVSLITFCCLSTASFAQIDQFKNAIPGDIEIRLSTHHELRAEYKIDDLAMKLRSKMSGAYKVSLLVSFEDIELEGSFDLVNESMTLDGHGAVLSDDHKSALTHARRHLIGHLDTEFENEFPEHSFLAVQMMGYWSKAPKGHVLGFREIETRQ